MVVACMWNCVARSNTAEAAQLRIRSPSIEVRAAATSNTGPACSSRASISAPGVCATMLTPWALTSGGNAVSSEIFWTLIVIRASVVAVATTNNASRRLPGPRSAPLVTFTATAFAAATGAERLSSYHFAANSTAASRTKTPTASEERREIRMSGSRRALKDEYGVPRALHGDPSEQGIDRCRQRRHQRERRNRQRTRQLRQVRQQPGFERRRIDAGDCAQAQSAFLEQLQVDSPDGAL